MPVLRIFVFALALLASPLLASLGARAQGQPGPGPITFAGKTMTIIVGTSAGGGYDTYARLFARHFSRHLPGAPTVVVQNMPGAGSNIAAAYIARVAPKDGTAIGAPFATQPLARILEDPKALRYEPEKLHYLGSGMKDIYLCVVRRDAPIAGFAEAFEKTIVMGGTAETGSTGYLPLLLNNVLGTKFKPVFGYPGSREILAAVEKGEVHGMCGINWSSLQSQYAHLLRDGTIRMLAQETETGDPTLDKKGVPRTFDFAKTDEQKKILRVIYAQGVFARPYFVGPDVPADRVALLRKAFLDTWHDPALVAEADKMQLVVDPVSGEDMQRLLAEINALPPELIEKVKQSIRSR